MEEEGGRGAGVRGGGEEGERRREGEEEKAGEVVGREGASDLSDLNSSFLISTHMLECRRASDQVLTLCLQMLLILI